MQQSQIKNLQEQIFVLTENVNSLKRLIFEYLQGDDAAPPPQQGGQQANPPKPLPTPKIVPVQGTGSNQTTATSRGPRGNRKNPARPSSSSGTQTGQSSPSSSATREVQRRGRP